MSITPYNNYTVADLTGVQQPYVNSTVEFGYFGSLGPVSNLYSMPTYLNTNNGIATVDASGGLNILQAGIYTLNLSIDCSATSMTISPTNNFGIIYFNFGTTKLNAVSLANITGSFGGTHTSGMFSYGSNATSYPGIIDWLVNSFTTGANTTPSKYYIKNNQLMWGYACNNFSNSGPLSSGICTTKITFIINTPTIIYLNTCCIDNVGIPVYTLTMGKSYFTLELISNIPPTIWNWVVSSTITTSSGCIASSSDGTQLFAGTTTTTGIYSSSNSGTTWSLLSNSNKGNWRSIASNSNSTNIVAGLNAGGIYYSPDASHNTWTLSSGAPSTVSESWRAIASSSDGTKLAAVNYGGGIYTSINSGVAWTKTNANNNNWFSIASSSDGTKLAATAYGTYIYTSSDASNNIWTPQTNGAPVSNWQAISSSSDGTKLAAGVNAGGIYYSSDSGNYWSKSDAPNNNWQAISSSSDGTKLVAVVNGGYIWSSSNSGVNWTQTNSPSTTWQGIALSSDGTKAAAVNTTSTPIYTGIYGY